MGSEDKFLSMMFIEKNLRREEENKKRDNFLLQLLEKSLKTFSIQSSTFRQGEELITEMISKTQTIGHDPECRVGTSNFSELKASSWSN